MSSTVDSLFDRQAPRAQALLLQALAAQPQRLDLAALAVAALENPDVDAAAFDHALESLALRVRIRQGERVGLDAALDALRGVLAEEEGLIGDDHNPSPAGASCVDAVLESKRGLPITLSVLYLEVARRADIALYGISFPGHFLIGADGRDGTQILDPFHGGQRMSFADCAALLKRYAPRINFTHALLTPATVPIIAGRMLANLKQVYLREGQGERALRAIDLLLLVAPDHPGELRARAALLSALGAYRAALVDVERCLELGPLSEDAGRLTAAAQGLRRQVERLN